MSIHKTPPVALPENFDPQNDLFSAIVLTPDSALKAAFSKESQSEFSAFLSLEQVKFATDQALKLFVAPETNSNETRFTYCRMNSTLGILDWEEKTRNERLKSRENSIVLLKQHGYLEEAKRKENIPPFIVGYEKNSVNEATLHLKAVDQPSFWIFGKAELHDNGLQYNYSHEDIFQQLLPPSPASKLDSIRRLMPTVSSPATPSSP